ncbi:alpha/beta fold hydrolase [Noviherbaspirillum galbum]|uniref:Alpha/beta fold hydrolase n=1 Tax=Noviherbaspirillum galbum TaxID=2709383 RepID=A0A6B3SLY9_9BURK|nr:alpha/beta fold hydrolase [Noviherbaspirillum galbum]NEX59686.1 alpha/beta fold hydrolase [Noviherbaspirillum galbum]
MSSVNTTPELSMASYFSSVRWCFEAMDQARRRRGIAMERAGLGPAQTPGTVVLEQPGARLHRFAAAKSASGAPAALIVPAPIKRHYIWDLSPGRSVVQRLMQHGMQVYLVEWTDPPSGPLLGLDDYGFRLLDACVQAIGGKVALFGHSLGGIFAAIYAAMRPDKVRALVTVESPLHFGTSSGSFQPLLAFGPQARQVTRSHATVPGSVLNLASMSASPTSFGAERIADFFNSLRSPDDMLGHLLVERWTLDEAPMSSRLFEEVVELLYRQDRLMLGQLDIQGKTIGPASIVSPFLTVIDPRSLIIPPESVTVFQDAASSRDKHRLAYDGDTGIGLAHVGALVGSNAHRLLWPAILGWLDSIPAR